VAARAAMQLTMQQIGGIASSLKLGPLSLRQIKEEISLGRPVVISYSGSFSGHVVVVFGYDALGNIHVHDPYYGTFTVPYGASFAYAGHMRWASTIYRIRPR